jgi:hypothetical protein
LVDRPLDWHLADCRLASWSQRGLFQVCWADLRSGYQDLVDPRHYGLHSADQRWVDQRLVDLRWADSSQASYCRDDLRSVDPHSDDSRLADPRLADLH